MADGLMLSERQRRWALYFVETGNASEAARRAGYAHKRADNAGYKNRHNALIMALVQEKLQEIEDKSIARAQEVLQYLTGVMRGETQSEVVVVESLGGGCREARKIRKTPEEKERLKAAELLAKRYGLLNDKALAGEAPTVIDDVIDSESGFDGGGMVEEQ